MYVNGPCIYVARLIYMTLGNMNICHLAHGQFLLFVLVSQLYNLNHSHCMYLLLLSLERTHNSIFYTHQMISMCGSRKYPYHPPPQGRLFSFNPPHPHPLGISIPEGSLMPPPPPSPLQNFYYFLYGPLNPLENPNHFVLYRVKTTSQLHK